ncbi:MAG: PEP-CTERM sorting domain-containing protein [Alphaproteobacteria bacterium]|nr:MAG: PEP-CTERM sorting domain-containing protein [Alphaproteobacteria bacterium]
MVAEEKICKKDMTMRLSRFTAFVTAAAATVLMAGAAHAVAIPGLFNTGVDAGGVALVGGNGVADPHYTVFSSDLAVPTGVSAVTYFNPAYAAEDADSRWISHSSNGSPGNGTTTFRLTFSLAGDLDPSTAVITGLWGADNSGAIFLNGVDTGESRFGFNALAPFTINSGFVTGLNTLDFVITDFGPPLAFRVDNISGTVDRLVEPPQPVPAPGALGLLAIGLAGLAMRRRR